MKYNVPFSCAPFWQFREIYTLNDQAKTSPSSYRGRFDNKCVEINVRETEGAIKNRQSRETGNIVYTRHTRQAKTKNLKRFVGLGVRLIVPKWNHLSVCLSQLTLY